jgi:hypothetical protein
MEAVALFALAGLGYVVTQISGDTKKENFQTLGNPKPSGVKFDLDGLDYQYETLTEMKPAASEPKPEMKRGLLSDFKDPPGMIFPDAKDVPQPKQDPLLSSTPDVSLNTGGVEENPNYVSGDFIYSELTGTKIDTDKFTHNNMTPFFGGSVKQNVSPSANNGILDTFSGSGSLQIKKREQEQMFESARSPYGVPFGLESSTDFIQSRINDPRSRAGERPFEPTRVGPAINEGFGTTGKGGFQQYEVNEYMIKNIKRTDELRTADNPKLTYNQPVVPGQHFIGGPASASGEVRKYRPDRFYIDESGERFGAGGQEGFQKETTRPVQVLKHQTRPETSSEIVGPAASQEFGESYVTGSYHLPQTQQYGGAGFRNADMTSYTSANTDAPEADYGRSAIEIRPNERNITGERVIGLNLVPADTGNVTIHFDDDARPTRRGETVGNIRQTGTPVGYANGAPAITVWDPNDVARTTVKEGTIHWNYMGGAASADAPNKLKVYDPDDIAKPTQKSQLSAKSDYFGTPNSVNKDFTSHDSAYNMRLNPNKQQIALGRDPLHGNGGSLAVFDGQIKQTTRRLDTDYVNDRTNAVNRVVSLPTGAGDIGRVNYKVPLKQDVYTVRNQREILNGIHDNPLFATQDLSRNAEHDEAIYQQMLQGM